jgi:hypothetical protein
MCRACRAKQSWFAEVIRPFHSVFWSRLDDPPANGEEIGLGCTKLFGELDAFLDDG